MAVSEEPHNPDVEILMKEGKEALENNDLVKANQFFHRALLLKPEDVDILIDIGNLYFLSKKMLIARDFYLSALSLKTSSQRPFHALGLLEKDLGNFEKAIEYFEQALHLKPNDSRLLHNLSNCHLKFNNFQLAEELSLKAIAANSANFVAYYGLSEVYSQLKRPEQVIAILEPFLSQAQTEEERKALLILLISSYLALQKYEEAMSLASELVDKTFDEIGKAEALRIKALIYFRQDNFEKASLFYKLCIELFPDSISFWESYLWTLANMSKPEKALESIEEALTLHGENSELLCHIGAIYFYLGKISSAFIYINKTLERDPMLVEGRVVLCLLYFHNQEAEKAITQAEQIANKLSSFTNQRFSIYLKRVSEELRCHIKFELSKQYLSRYLELNNKDKEM